MQVADDIRFLHWHSLRYLLYSDTGWDQYLKTLFGLSTAHELDVADHSWTWNTLIYNNGTDPHSTVNRDAGSIEFYDKDFTVLATITMQRVASLDSRFDYPNSFDSSSTDRWRGLNPDVLEFNCVAPRMHAMIMVSGQCAGFRIVSAAHDFRYTAELCHAQTVAVGTVGLVGSGCDIEMEDIDFVQGKILKFTKFQIRLES